MALAAEAGGTSRLEDVQDSDHDKHHKAQRRMKNVAAQRHDCRVVPCAGQIGAGHHGWHVKDQYGQRQDRQHEREQHPVVPHQAP